MGKSGFQYVIGAMMRTNSGATPPNLYGDCCKRLRAACLPIAAIITNPGAMLGNCGFACAPVPMVDEFCA